MRAVCIFRRSATFVRCKPNIPVLSSQILSYTYHVKNYCRNRQGLIYASQFRLMLINTESHWDLEFSACLNTSVYVCVT